MYGFEGLSIIFLFLFLLLSGSLAGGVERRSNDLRRDRRKLDPDWESICGAVELPRATKHAAQLQVALFRLAKRRGGVLTLSDIIVETGLGVQDAEELMETLVDNTYVRVEVTAHGQLVYEFPELMNR